MWSFRNPWQDVATQIAAALYGPCKRQVRLSNQRIADIIPWLPRPRQDPRGRVEFAHRIIEVKVGHRRAWQDPIRKYKHHCRWLEVCAVNCYLPGDSGGSLWPHGMRCDHERFGR